MRGAGVRNMRGQYSLEETLRLVMESRLRDVHVSCPGRVVSYDPDTQTATVRPTVKRDIPSPVEGFLQESLPEIHGVRVLHPGGAGWSIHIPMQEGDEVLLVFNEWDPSEWQRTGQVSPAPDKRLHNLAHAVAIAGYRSDPRQIQGASNANVTITHPDGLSVTFTPTRMEVGGSSDAAALASRVANLETNLNNHIHTTTATVGVGAVGVISTPTNPSNEGPFGSDYLKLGG